MNSLIARVGIAGDVASWGVIVIVVAAIIGIVLVIMRVANVQPPPGLVNIGWIVLAAIVGVLAIMFLMRLVGGGM